MITIRGDDHSVTIQWRGINLKSMLQFGRFELEWPIGLGCKLG